MVRALIPLFCLAMLVSPTKPGLAQADLPDASIIYEVIINGEVFQVEGNRMTKVQSKEKPEVTYDLAVRISPTRRMALNTVQFDYELPAKVTDDRGKLQRTVQVKHEFGFSAMVTDLGGRVDVKGEEEVLKALTESLSASFREQKATALEVTPSSIKIAGAAGRGCKIRYQKAEYGHTCFVYVLSGEKFTVTCVVQFLDNDSDDVLPLLKKLFNSFRARP